MAATYSLSFQLRLYRIIGLYKFSKRAKIFKLGEAPEYSNIGCVDSKKKKQSYKMGCYWVFICEKDKFGSDHLKNHCFGSEQVC